MVDLAWNDARDAATRILSALCDGHGRNSAMTARLPGLMDAMTHSLSLQVLRNSNPRSTHLRERPPSPPHCHRQSK